MTLLPSLPKAPASDASGPTWSDRPRALAELDGPWRIAIVAAPAGFGKTATVLRWARRSELPVLWRDLSTSGHDRASIWRGLLDDLRWMSATPSRAGADADNVEGDPLNHLVAAFAPDQRAGEPVVVVFDRVDEISDPGLWVDLDRLIDGGAEGLRVVLIARSVATIPAGRWRATGAVIDVGADDLGFAEGDDGPDPSVAIVDIIDETHRAAALRLAVPESFDAAVAAAVAGPGAGDSALFLVRRGLLERTGAGGDRMRFDPALRRVLLKELRAVDPEGFRTAHLTLSRVLADGGDLAGAYRALTAAGESRAEHRLVTERVLGFAEQGDRAAVDRALAALPAPDTVDEPNVVLAVAHTCLLTRRYALAGQWAGRLSRFVGLDAALADESRIVRAQLRLLEGDPDGSEREVAGCTMDDGSPPDVRIRRSRLAARLSLTRGDPAAARRHLAEADSPESPADQHELELLAAWCDALDGEVQRSAARAEALASTLSGRSSVRPGRRAPRCDQTTLDAAIVAAWARYQAGDYARAHEHAARALGDAEGLRSDWNLLRAGAIAVRTLLRVSGPAAARSLLIETHLRRRSDTSPLDGDLDRAEVDVLRTLGRIDAARELLDRLADEAPNRLARASLEVSLSGRVDTPGLLDGAASWTVPQRIEASVLTSSSDPDALADVVAEAGGLGLVTPLLHHGASVDAALSALPLERLHPRLAEHLPASHAQPPSLPSGAPIAITPRERTVLALLPSHLTYEQIAERLSLSVNTVKSNLKSIYRKLSVASRSDAVEAARAAKLV